MKRNFRRLSVLAFLTFTGCQQPVPQHAMWSGTVQLADGKDLAFRMDLDLAQPKPAGYFLVGNEKTPIPEISRNGDSLNFQFSEYGAEMRTVWDGHQLRGTYVRYRSEGTRSFPVHASPEAAGLADAVPADAVAPIGTYQVHFQDDNGSGRVTVARVWTEGTRIYGTFIAPDGDYGLLDGKPTAKGIQFGRFTGWQAFLIEFESEGSQWSGTFYAASNDKPRPFTLGPLTEAALEASPTAVTSMKHPQDTFTFSCSSLSGETVRNTEDRFRGKALVVDIMGTWCHNCLDEAPVLQRLQDKFRNDGLEVVGLSFEVTDDAEIGRRNLSLYRDRFGLTYTLLFCGSVDDANQETRLKTQLENFFAFPTTLFIDKTGKVRTIHAGFRGPGTGQQYQSQVQELEELARGIVR